MTHPTRRPGAPLAGLLLAALSCACVSTRHESRDWSTYDGPGARYFQAEEIVFPYEQDPLEPVNRVSAGLTYAFLRWILAPSAAVWRFFVPRPARTHLEQAGENLRFPTRFVNNVLQGKPAEAGVEAARFVINSTVGLLGLFDPAQDWGLHPYPEDFGQTFARWGWRNSTFLVLPVLGPSTVRDGLGEIPDAYSDPASYFFPAAQARAFNAASNRVESDLRAIEASYDPYETGRTLFSLQRVVDVTDFEWRQDESGATQTLRSIFLEPQDEDFAGRGSTESVALEHSGGDLPYGLWLQPEPAPLLYVVPGFGGHRLGPSTLALAEIGHRFGHSVVAVSSPSNWEFMRHASSVSVPGHGPVDALDLHRTLTAIDRQLETRLPGRLLQRRIVGLSLGAHQALLMAAGREQLADGRPGPGGLLEFERILALNPPVELAHALAQLDRFYNAPLEFPTAEREARIEEIFGKVLYLSQGELEPGTPLPFSELESRFLIGLAFRLDLQFVILQSQDLEDSGVLRTPRSRLHRAPAFREAAEFSFMEYFYAFLLPYYAERDPDIGFDEAGSRRLLELSDLRAAGEALSGNQSVHVLTNEKDFLLLPEHLSWLHETIGPRLDLFEEGGHLGNLYRDYLRTVIGETLEEPRGSSQPRPEPDRRSRD